MFIIIIIIVIIISSSSNRGRRGQSPMSRSPAPEHREASGRSPSVLIAISINSY